MLNSPSRRADLLFDLTLTIGLRVPAHCYAQSPNPKDSCLFSERNMEGHYLYVFLNVSLTELHPWICDDTGYIPAKNGLITKRKIGIHYLFWVYYYYLLKCLSCPLVQQRCQGSTQTYKSDISRIKPMPQLREAAQGSYRKNIIFWYSERFELVKYCFHHNISCFKFYWQQSIREAAEH